MNGIARSYVVYTIYIYYSPEDMFASIFKQASGAWCEYVATSCLKGMRVAMRKERHCYRRNTRYSSIIQGGKGRSEEEEDMGRVVAVDRE